MTGAARVALLALACAACGGVRQDRLDGGTPTDSAGADTPGVDAPRDDGVAVADAPIADAVSDAGAADAGAADAGEADAPMPDAPTGIGPGGVCSGDFEGCADGLDCWYLTAAMQFICTPECADAGECEPDFGDGACCERPGDQTTTRVCTSSGFGDCP
ncbi:MAG: hypothetical protein AABZ30_08695 [Myxococcota bacterium]